MATGLQTAHRTLNQEAFEAAFQSFVSSSDFLSPTSTVGSPATGFFYSSVVNRSQIPDLSKDLLAQMGFDRFVIQQIHEIPTEQGPNGERVFGCWGDTKNAIRIVGDGVFVNNDSTGQRIHLSVNDYIEIIFFGTGLNMLTLADAGSRQAAVSIDGGAEDLTRYPFGANLPASLLTGQLWNPNQVINLASGLPLGVHTIRLRSSTVNFQVYGYEIVNQSTTINVNPGTAYIKNQKAVLSALQSLVYNSGFESGTLGTRGGRVLLYLKQDQSIGRSVTPVNTTSAFLTSTDHSNEQMARVFHWREFGSGRSDDFATLVAGSFSSRGYTLEDGTTTLTTNGSMANALPSGEGLMVQNSSGFHIMFTFVGTGLDILCAFGSGNTTTGFVITVDGASVGTSSIPTGIIAVRNLKIASGLPYGTHTVKIATNVTGSGSYGILNFKVYTPRKPVLPADAIELADYNVMADYVFNSGVALGVTSQGVIRKSPWKEVLFANGTGGADWSTTVVDATSLNMGNRPHTTHNGSWNEHYIFGTGFEIKGVAAASESSNVLVQINGLTVNTINFPSMSAQTTTGFSFNSSTGVLNCNNAVTSFPTTLSIRGLPLNYYRVRFTNQTTAAWQFQTFEQITPIHAVKSSRYSFQNVRDVHCGIADKRKTDLLPVKTRKRAIGHALGLLSNPTTTSTSYVPLPDMTVPIYLEKAAWVEVEIGCSMSPNVSLNQATLNLGVFVDGVQINRETTMHNWAAGSNHAVFGKARTFLGEGFHMIQGMWRRDGTGTVTGEGVQRYIFVKELDED